MAFQTSISRFQHHTSQLFCVAFALLLVIMPDTVKANPVRYYLSLGTSLAVGVQPDGTGENKPTEDGYPDHLFSVMRQVNPKLELVKLGCPSETTTSMIEGGKCFYSHGSQLNAAKRFLHAHKDKVELVTIDIGVNDLFGCIEGTAINLECLDAAFSSIMTNLGHILFVLDEASAPQVAIVGMNYYNPFLANWLLGAPGQAFAIASANLAALFNIYLGAVYDNFGIPVADVAGLFQSSDFATVVPFPLPPDFMAPINVATICQLTYMCSAAPVGPNIHLTTAGYDAIATAFLAALPY